MARLLPPESAGLADVSREVGIGVSTLERWRSDALSRPARERIWTAAARFDALLTTAAMDEAGNSAWWLAETAALLVLSREVGAIFNTGEAERSAWKIAKPLPEASTPRTAAALGFTWPARSPGSSCGPCSAGRPATAS